MSAGRWMTAAGFGTTMTAIGLAFCAAGTLHAAPPDAKPAQDKPTDKPAATPAETRPAPKPDPKAPLPVRQRFRVMGLFNEGREADLRAAVDKTPGLVLVSVDVAKGEADFEFDAKALFNTTRADQVLQRLNNAVSQHSRGTFSVKAPVEAADKDVAVVEIGVEGLDCKGCEYAAYKGVCDIDGVLSATVSFRTGIVRARIDRTKVDRPALEAGLKKRGVHLASPADAKK